MENPGIPIGPQPEGISSDVSGDPSPPFRPRLGTYILLFFLLIIWPATSLAFLFLDDTQIDWDLYDPVYFIYIPTIVIQWFIFLAISLGVYREESSFRSIGFVKFHLKDIFSAVVFLVISNIILSLLQMIFAGFDITISQDVDILVEKARESVWWWLGLCVTVAICEEAVFRGYLMTRIRGLIPKGGWIIPVILSSLSFASGHSYQGIAGLILLFFYGLLFCGLYLYTRSLWPCVLAHFIQDFSAIFLYDYMDF